MKRLVPRPARLQRSSYKKESVAMVRTILVPLDGSSSAEAALPPALAVARAQHAQLVLLRAVPMLDAEAVLAEEEHAYATAATYLDQLYTSYAGTGLVRGRLVDFGEPAEAILAAIDREQASMVAMSTHGRSGIRRVLLGSIAERVLHHTTVPMLLVRAAESGEQDALAGASPPVSFPDLPRRVLLPLDGSTCAEYAIQFVQNQGLLHDAEVLLVRAVPSVVTGSTRTAPASILQHVDREAALATEHDLVEAQQYLEQVVREQLHGIQCRILAVAGYPAKRIIEIAQAEQVDLIAMVSHQHAGVSRFVTGTVTGHVLHHTPVPLLVLHHQPADSTCEPADSKWRAWNHGDPPQVITLPPQRLEDD
jgi:nucleotide-binding universal stress UspA family protein